MAPVVRGNDPALHRRTVGDDLPGRGQPELTKSAETVNRVCPDHGSEGGGTHVEISPGGVRTHHRKTSTPARHRRPNNDCTLICEEVKIPTSRKSRSSGDEKRVDSCQALWLGLPCV